MDNSKLITNSNSKTLLNIESTACLVIVYKHILSSRVLRELILYVKHLCLAIAPCQCSRCTHLYITARISHIVNAIKVAVPAVPLLSTHR